MFLTASASATLSFKPFLSPFPSSSSSRNTPSLLFFSSASNPHRPLSISAVHVAEPTKEPPASSVTSPLATTAKWSIDSWKFKKALQLPKYPDKAELESVLKKIESFPPIVFASEASVEYLVPHWKWEKEVGRIAGQFAMPQIDPYEEKDGVKLSSYRGDIIDGNAFDEKSRIPDPNRMIVAYNQSVATLTLLRSVIQWDSYFLEYCDEEDRDKELPRSIEKALEFHAAARRIGDHPITSPTDFWTSHECLLLPYEQALTREDSATGLYYDCSAHMLWLGEQTCQLDGAHVEFLRGVANPLGIMVSDKMDPEELVKLIEILNPQNKPGRITIITRMGAENMRVKLPHLIRAVRGAGQLVTWVSDPMHGNTIKDPCGLGTCDFDAIQADLMVFFDVHEQEGSHPGGIHLGMTGQKVTECIDGIPTATFDDLISRYDTPCNPWWDESLHLGCRIMGRIARRS